MNRIPLAKEWLAGEMLPHWLRVHDALLEELARAWSAWLEERITAGDVAWAAPDRAGHTLVSWLLLFIRECSRTLEELLRSQTRFTRAHDRAETRAERDRILLDTARELGATPRQLRGDRRGLSRWFDRDAVIDRFLQRRAREERRMAFALECLGRVASRLISREMGNGGTPGALWAALDMEETLRDLFSHEGDHRVAMASFHALGAALRALPPGHAAPLAEEPTLRFIFRSAMESRQNVWIQTEALALLEILSPDSLEAVLYRRLGQPGPGDDLFVRRRAVTILLRSASTLPSLGPLLDSVCHDPSPFVRQGLALDLAHIPCDRATPLLAHLASQDAQPSVRAAALLSLVKRFEGAPALDPVPVIDLLTRRMEEEKDNLVVRTLFHVSVLLGRTLAGRKPPGESPPSCLSILEEAVARCAAGASSTLHRRWAALAGERLWLAGDGAARPLADRLRPFLDTIRTGSSRRLPADLAGALPEETLGRVLSVLAQEDFPLELSRGILGMRLHRGHRFAFRWWRFLHEMTHTSPDKRQGFSHVTGRHFSGHIRAPSAILNEMSPTKVPGEPLHLDEEGGWRPFLPLLDDMVSTLEMGKRVVIHSSQGMTEIRPPRLPWQRMRALAILTRRFAEIAPTRNHKKGSGGDPAEYLKILTGLGFTIRFQPHYADPSAARHFPALGLLPATEISLRFEDYFFSAYENSLFELLLFSLLAAGWFLGRHLLLGLTMRRNRGRLPLVIGGWGTRGKSGTERLKAAVFHSLGLGVISKTTGCEAMFLHAPPFLPMREMFLFRPYDKATIWEQHNLVAMASQLECQVFLWECMALTPSYVSLLQRDWMRDDFSTIVNAYPDHEDIQGPAGIDIPAVIAQFIPKGACLVSSEEQMAPILQEEALRVGTTMDETTWLDAGLLTPDILARFPYAEHPNNIALVTRLCHHLGLPADLALKAMADHVIPDIGVLKIYPPSRIGGRRLSFVNGMSANERLGCLVNWNRTGFATQDPESEPDTWIMTVVNNRADRIARSKVFARLLVQDVAVDRHVLIGGNLAGLQGYIEEEMGPWLEELTLWGKEGEEDPHQRLTALARRMRIPTSAAAVVGRVASMLQGGGMEPGPAWATAETLVAGEENAARILEGRQIPHLEEVATWVTRFREDLVSLEALRLLLDTAASDRARVDGAVRTQARRWFLDKIIVIWDYHATGNDIIRQLARETPPGLHGRIMGVQNIKGTGLDFVYRWQAWGQCHDACVRIASGLPGQTLEGIRQLALFQDYGPLCETMTRETVALAMGLPETQSERVQADLKMILSALETALARDLATAHQGVASGGRWDRFLTAVEAFLDAGDAVARRKQADLIYRDLIAQRVSRQRAANLLGELIKRQKGGWLKKRVSTLFGRDSSKSGS